MNSSDNPYVGLRPFKSEESLLFFGRSNQVVELLQRLHAHHFVAVVGGSGSGKSSLVRAGLIPALQAGYLVDNSDAWNIGTMKPGRQPLHHMADSLTRMADPGATDSAVAEMLTQIEEGGAEVILDILEPIYRRHRTNFFLLVDQFEELFRYSVDTGDTERRDQAIDFVNIMLELTNQQRVPVYVVLTMRSDFIGDCAEFYGLPEAMNQSLYLVPRMSREDLKQVIESPAKLFGKQVSTRLTSRLLNAMNRVKDELPLLQHALMRMWEYELKADHSGMIDLADYDGVGRLEKALSQHANEALESLDLDQRQLAATIFKTLTTVDANGRKIRRPSTMSELVSLSGETEDKIRQVIDKFIEDRRSFIILGNEKDPVVDISHESLIRQWKQLERWADQEADAADQYLKLSNDYLSWKDGKKDPLSGRELELSMEWYNSFKPDKNWASRYNDLYEDCERFLLDSQESADAVASEQAQKDARLRNLKRTLVTALIVLGPITAFFVGREVAQKMGIEIDWNNYDTLWEGARSIDNVQGYLFFLQENPDAPEELLQAAADSIRSKELDIDERNWNKADSINSLPAYQQYLDLAGAYVFPEAEGLHIEDANQVIQRLADATNTDFKKEELAWETFELSDGTFSDYLDYLIALDEITEPAVQQDSTVQVHRQFILDRIDSDKREGWLFSGRLNEDKTMVVKDATFDVVWRRQTVDDPRILPEVGDYVKSLLVRSTYKNKIDGGGVFERNDGEPIRQGEKAIISEVAVEGNVVYYKIEY